MSNELTPAQILNDWGYPSFRNIKKEDFIDIYNRLQSLPLEQRQAIIDKIPEFAEFVTNFAGEMNTSFSTAMQSNDTSVTGLKETRNLAIEKLSEIALSDGITQEDKMHIAEDIKEIVQDARQDDSDNKNFIERHFRAIVGTIGVGVTVCVAAILQNTGILKIDTSKIKLPRGKR